MTHSIPAHLTPHAKAPARITYPSRPNVEELCRTRANHDNARWERQVQQRQELIAAAAEAGRNEGERAGWKLGYRWGFTCGVTFGAITVACTWVMWAQALQPWLVALRLL